PTLGRTARPAPGPPLVWKLITLSLSTADVGNVPAPVAILRPDQLQRLQHRVAKNPQQLEIGPSDLERHVGRINRVERTVDRSTGGNVDVVGRKDVPVPQVNPGSVVLRDRSHVLPRGSIGWWLNI